MSAGMIAAQITVPTAGHSISTTITAIGTFTVTVAAGTYFPSEYLTAWNVALDAASGADGAWTVSANLTDTTGTGLVTIAHATQTFTITWTNTNARDILGFTGTLTPAALTFTGTTHLRGVWLPDCPIDSRRGANAGHTETNRAQLVGPTGAISATGYGVSRVAMSPTSWSHITLPKALTASETTTGASYETWLLQTHGATLSYFSTAPQVRVYHNATGSLIGTYRLIWDGSTDFDRADPTWIYLWQITLPRGYAV